MRDSDTSLARFELERILCFVLLPSCPSGLLLCDRRDCGNLALVVSGQGRVGLADIFFHQPVWLVGLSLSPAGLASGIITGRSG